MQNFSQLLQRLADAGLEFVIVGGYAAVAHGSFQLTRDVDICAVLTEADVAKLRQDMGVIDVISSVLGVGVFQRLNTKAEELEVDGRRFRVISLDDLITAKEAMGREKDLLTAKELRAIAAKRRAMDRG